MNGYFNEIKGKLGFGCMRLPLNPNGEVDSRQFCLMIDEYMMAGFNYFDTARGYLRGASERGLKNCLVARYPRENFVLTDKLSVNYFHSESDILPLFRSQLEACGVEYFDFYLMHAQNAEYYEKYKRTRAYETAYRLKAEGKVRHVGLSFHDKAEVLDRILTEQPQIEVVQIQFNYLDYLDPVIESKLCYETCIKHGKPMFIMEPVKGGTLADLDRESEEILQAAGKGSAASFALRYAAGFDGVAAVLSGMSDAHQVRDNTEVFGKFIPLSEREAEAVEKVRKRLVAKQRIPCTNCRYCVAGCPSSIPIPDVIKCLNDIRRDRKIGAEQNYRRLTNNLGKASDCIKCGKCENICPQKIEIRDALEDAAAAFDQK